MNIEVYSLRGGRATYTCSYGVCIDGYSWVVRYDKGKLYPNNFYGVNYKGKSIEKHLSKLAELTEKYENEIIYAIENTEIKTIYATPVPHSNH